jgi:hypothetical protein
MTPIMVFVFGEFSLGMMVKECLGLRGWGKISGPLGQHLGSHQP